jgi:hypothetical protein
MLLPHAGAASSSAIKSANVKNRSVTFAAIAGVTRILPRPAAEIVVGEKQRDRRFQVKRYQYHAEGIGRPGQPQFSVR